jgi:hypothetical protein
MKNKSIAIAILDRNKKLLGFKSDTFWTLARLPKIHTMNAGGQIDTHLVPNLLGLLNGKRLFEENNGPSETYMNQRELFIAAYPCPPDGENYVYPRTEMEEWVKDLPTPTILFRLHRISWNMNGIDKPWIADLDLELEEQPININPSLN